MIGRISGAIALSLLLVGIGSGVASAAPVYAQGESATVLNPEGTITLKKWDGYHLSGAFPDGTQLYVREPWFNTNSFKAYGGTNGVAMRLTSPSTVSTSAAALIDKGSSVALIVHAEDIALSTDFTGGIDWNTYPPDWVGKSSGNGTLATTAGSARLKYMGGDLAAAEQVQFAPPTITYNGGTRYQSVTIAGQVYDLDTPLILNSRFDAVMVADPYGTPSYDANGNYTGMWKLTGRVGYGLADQGQIKFTHFPVSGGQLLVSTAALKTVQAEAAPFLPIMWQNTSLVDVNSGLPRGYDVNKEKNSSLVQTYYGCWVSGDAVIAQARLLAASDTPIVGQSGVTDSVNGFTKGVADGLGLGEITIPGSIDDTSSAPSVGSNKWATYLRDQVAGLAGQLSGLLWPLHLFTDLLGG